MILREAGYSVDTAETGRACMATLHRADFDLLLLGPAIRATDGRTLLRRLRRAAVDIPIVMIGALADVQAQ